MPERIHGRLFVSAACCLLLVTIGPARAANLFGGNGVLRIAVSDGQQFFKCGVWTAVTDELHPAGPGLPLIDSQNGGFPVGGSFVTLHSYHTGASYTTNDFCESLCLAAGQPYIETITRAGVDVGFRLIWRFRDAPPGSLPGPRLQFTQEVVVEGPVDGTQTPQNTLVRETHTVRNLGPGELRFGLRKVWDLLVGDDWGPWLGSCETPDAACDRSLDLTPTGAAGPAYPRNLVIHPDPAAAACPPGFPPNHPEGCSGAPDYVVVASAGLPTGLDPRPYPPEVLQFNLWNAAVGPCWGEAPLVDTAECGEDDLNSGTALVYLYGPQRTSAIRLGPGRSRSFTQYVGATTGDCPAALTDDGSR